MNCLLKNGSIVTPEGLIEADVIIKENRIEKILKRPYEPGLMSQTDPKLTQEIDASGFLIFPALIDCHVHFREPGLEHKETMETGMAAALAGGVTTVCEMPNTVPPTTSVEALADKVRRAKELGMKNKELGIDIRFFFGATEMGHLDELKKLFTDPSLKELRGRCCGLKLYFDHSTGNQGADAGVIEEAFKICAELGVQVVGHCEDAKMNEEKRNPSSRSGLTDKSDVAFHSLMRPPEAEVKAVEDAIRLAKKYGTRFHVAHLSTKGALELVRSAKKAGIAITCEVAPHHLFMTVDDYKALGTLAKMNPPLRTRDHQEALWQGIADGTVDCVSTDHAPHTLDEKNVGDWRKAPSGVPGVETMLPLLLSVAAGEWPGQIKDKREKRTAAEENLLSFHFSLFSIYRLCFTNPNHIFNLGKKGIVEGAPADLILVDPKHKWAIRGKELHSKCGWTPFEGWEVQGKTVQIA